MRIKPPGVPHGCCLRFSRDEGSLSGDQARRQPPAMPARGRTSASWRALSPAVTRARNSVLLAPEQRRESTFSYPRERIGRGPEGETRNVAYASPSGPAILSYGFRLVFSHARVRPLDVARPDTLRYDAFEVHPARMTNRATDETGCTSATPQPNVTAHGADRARMYRRLELRLHADAEPMPGSQRRGRSGSSPDILKRLRRHGRVAHRVRDRRVAEVVLQATCIHSFGRQGITGGVAQHVDVYGERQPRSRASALYEACNAHTAKRLPTPRSLTNT